MSFSVNSFLDKCANRDPDYRNMAGRDLAKELEKETFKLDPQSEKKVMDAVMALIRDNNNLVQEQAVKCIGPLLRKVDAALVEKAVLSLSDDLIDPKNEENRDTALLALKSITSDINPGSPVIKDVLIGKQTPKLLAAVRTVDNQGVKIAALELLSELLRRYGRMMNTQHKELLDTCLKYLTTTQKRAITCLSFLVSVVPENTFLAFMKEFISTFNQTSKPEYVKTYVQCFGVLCQNVGHRVGKFIKDILPLIVKNCESINDVDLRDSCFTAFTALAENCPKEVTPYLSKILLLCLRFAKYDPLFGGEEDEDMEDADAAEEEEEEEEGGEDDDDDDGIDEEMSYKIRKGAVKTMAAVFTSHPETLTEYAEKACRLFVKRFTEPVEDVRLDVLAACTAMVKAKLASQSDAEKVQKQIKKQIPQLVKGITQLLKRKKEKPKPPAFVFMTELITAIPACLADNIGTILPAITNAIGDAKSSFTLKIEALTFLRLMINSHPPASVHPHVGTIFPHMLKTIADPFNRISAEALQVAIAFVYAIRAPNTNLDFKQYVDPLYNAALKQAQASATDQNVKENAIECLGVMLAVVGDALKQQSDCIKLIVTHLQREHARAAVVKVLPIILKSQLKIDLSPHLTEMLTELSSFLKKNDRPLQEASLVAMNGVIAAYGTVKQMSQMAPTVIAELAGFVASRSTDLYLVHLAFTVCCTIVKQQGATAVQAIQDKLLPQTFKLLSSAMLQGVALESLLKLYEELVVVNAKNLSFTQLLDSVLALTKPAKDYTPSKQVLHVVAQCVGVICNKNPKGVASVVDNFIKDAKSKEDLPRQVALLCLGSIGRLNDLSSYELHNLIFPLFESTSDTKQAAAFALGNIALGNMGKYLPIILNQFQKSSTQTQRLLLVSLRECMVLSMASTVLPHVETILKLLFVHCDADDIPTRDTVSECVGKLIQISPDTVMPKVVECFTSRSSSKRGTMVASIKFALTENLATVDAALGPHIQGVFDQLKFTSDDKAKTLFVRERAIMSLKSLCAQKPQMIRDVISQNMPLLYAETIPKQEYITIVELGLIKVTVDDALNARKDAYDCLNFILKKLPEKVEVPSFVRSVAPGLVDVYDIRIVVHSMLNLVSTLAPSALLEGSDLLIPSLVLCARLDGTGKRNEEADRNEEMQTSTFNVIALLSKLPNAESFPKLQEMLETLAKDKDIGEKFKKAMAAVSQ